MIEKDPDAVPMPDIDFSDVTDYYTFYVSIMGVSESVFWNEDIGFVMTIAGNKQAFDKWLERQRKLRGKQRNRKK